MKQGESELEQCYLHMEKGEPPTLSMEQEWMRFVRDDGRRQEERKEKALVSAR